MPKGHRGDPIQVDSADDMESDREWDDIEVEVCHQPPQCCSTSAVFEVKVLYQAVPLTNGRTLGMTLRPRRGGCGGGGGNDSLESG